jgi:tRNA dimethylallyltransferase
VRGVLVHGRIPQVPRVEETPGVERTCTVRDVAERVVTHFAAQCAGVVEDVPNITLTITELPDSFACLAAFVERMEFLSLASTEGFASLGLDCQIGFGIIDARSPLEMAMPPTPEAFADALVLTGPTGSGKSALAIDIAEELGCEILAMDSMTLYRGMDIGTAKPSREEQARVPHHLIDVLDPWESGSVTDWLARADAACQQIRQRGRRPLFVGGTPFYLKALLHGLFESPEIDPQIRRRLEAEAAAVGPLVLHARLQAIDPRTATRLHPNDVRRVVRALEVFEGTGRPISELQRTWNTATFSNDATGGSPGVRAIWLNWPREELYERINRRVLGMLEIGWLDEARRLLTLPRPLSPEAEQALGYRDLFAFLEGKQTWEATVDWIQTHTRQFAKRQLTWLRSLPECYPISPAEGHRVLDFFRTNDAARLRGEMNNLLSPPGESEIFN